MCDYMEIWNLLCCVAFFSEEKRGGDREWVDEKGVVEKRGEERGEKKDAVRRVE